MRDFESELQNTIVQIVGSFKRSMSQAMKQQGWDLSPLHFLIIRSIHLIEGCTPNTLSNYLKKDKAQITRLLNPLLKQGIVQKIANPNDKRSQYLTLTDKGLEWYTVLQASDLETLAAMRKGISDEELAQFLLIGEKMAGNLERAADESSNH